MCQLPPISADFTIGPDLPQDAKNFVVDVATFCGMFLVPVLITTTCTVNPQSEDTSRHERLYVTGNCPTQESVEDVSERLGVDVLTDDHRFGEPLLYQRSEDLTHPKDVQLGARTRAHVNIHARTHAHTHECGFATLVHVACRKSERVGCIAPRRSCVTQFVCICLDRAHFVNRGCAQLTASGTKLRFQC